MSGLDFLFNKKKRKSYFDEEGDSSLDQDYLFKDKKSVSSRLQVDQDEYRFGEQQTPFLKSNYRHDISRDEIRQKQKEFVEFDSDDLSDHQLNSRDVGSFQKRERPSLEVIQNTYEYERNEQALHFDEMPRSQQSVTRGAPQSVAYSGNDPAYVSQLSQSRKTIPDQPMHSSSVGLHDRMMDYNHQPFSRHVRESLHHEEPCDPLQQGYESSSHLRDQHGAQNDQYNYANHVSYKPPFNPHQQNRDYEHRGSVSYETPTYQDPYSESYSPQIRRSDDSSSVGYSPHRESSVQNRHYSEGYYNRGGNNQTNRLMGEEPFYEENFLSRRNHLNLLPASQTNSYNDGYERSIPSSSHVRSFPPQGAKAFQTPFEKQGERSIKDGESVVKSFFSRPLMRKAIWMGVGFLFSSGFGAGLYWYLKPSETSEIPVIRAQKGPYKISNEKVNELEEHRDNVIYDRLMPQGFVSQNNEKVLDSNEDTINPPQFDDEDELEEPIPVNSQNSAEYDQQQVLVPEGAQPSILQPEISAATHVPTERVIEAPRQNVDEAVRQLTQESVVQKSEVVQSRNNQVMTPDNQSFLIQLGTLSSSKKASVEKKRLQKKYQKFFKREIEMRQTVLNSGQKVYRLLVHLKFTNIKAAKDFCKSIGGACKVLQP